MNPTDIKLWVMGGLLTVLIPVLAYLLTRELARKDQVGEDLKSITAKFTTSIEELNKAVAALTLACEEIRLWSTEKFVSRDEHRNAVESIREDIARTAERFSRDLDKCGERCPARHGDAR